MSKVEVDQVDPQSGTTLTLGTSGDTVSIPSGVTLANAGTVTGIPTSALTGTIATAQIADDAVTLAKMAPGTDGNIISYDASGNPVAVATGSAGQILTSAGAGAPPTFAAAAEAGGFVKLQTQTAASDVSNIAFSSTYLTSTYLKYFVCGSVISAQTPGSAAVYFQLLPSIDNGSNYNLDIAGFGEGSYNNVANNNSGKSTGGFQYGSGDNRLGIMGAVRAGNQTAMLGMVSFSGYVVNSPNYSKTRSSQYFGTANRMYAPNSSDYHTMPTYSGGTSFESGSAWNNLKFQFSAGNISAGSTITLFGVSQ